MVEELKAIIAPSGQTVGEMKKGYYVVLALIGVLQGLLAAGLFALSFPATETDKAVALGILGVVLILGAMALIINSMHGLGYYSKIGRKSVNCCYAIALAANALPVAVEQILVRPEISTTGPFVILLILQGAAWLIFHRSKIGRNTTESN